MKSVVLLRYKLMSEQLDYLGFQHVSGTQSLPNRIQHTWDLAGLDGA